MVMLLSESQQEICLLFSNWKRNMSFASLLSRRAIVGPWPMILKRRLQAFSPNIARSSSPAHILPNIVRGLLNT
jgi:hypothetical protein